MNTNPLKARKALSGQLRNRPPSLMRPICRIRYANGVFKGFARAMRNKYGPIEALQNYGEGRVGE